MNLQRLKNSLAMPFLAVNDRVNRFLLYLQNPLNLFRFIAVLLVVDFVAFMSLTRSSYVQMLNPLAFLSAGPGETRDSIELYFPRSLSLTGIDKIYPEEENSARPSVKVKSARSTMRLFRLKLYSLKSVSLRRISPIQLAPRLIVLKPMRGA